VLTLALGQVGPALISLVVGCLAAFVAYGRWRLAPLRASVVDRTRLGAERPT
jgi:hypothetical protein